MGEVGGSVVGFWALSYSIYLTPWDLAWTLDP